MANQPIAGESLTSLGINHSWESATCTGHQLRSWLLIDLGEDQEFECYTCQVEWLWNYYCCTYSLT